MEPPLSCVHTCPFFRIWNCAEILAAISQNKPLVILVGQACEDGRFEVRDGPFDRRMCRTSVECDSSECHESPLGGLWVATGGMLETAMEMMDVRRAAATVPSDRERELGALQAAPGGFAVANARCRGAMAVAMHTMRSPHVMYVAPTRPHAVNVHTCCMMLRCVCGGVPAV